MQQPPTYDPRAPPLFLPVVPIHASSHYLGVSLTSNEVTATLMGLTMSSVAEGSPVLW